MDCLNKSYTLQSNIAGMTLVAASANHNNSSSPSKRLRPQELEHDKEIMASDQKTFVPKILHHDGSTCAPGFMSNIGSAINTFNGISPRPKDERKGSLTLQPLTSESTNLTEFCSDAPQKTA